MPASAAGKESRTCQCVRSHRNGGIEPPDPVQDQDLPAVQVTAMRVAHTGPHERPLGMFRLHHTLTISWGRRGEGHKAADLALDLQAQDK